MAQAVVCGKKKRDAVIDANKLQCNPPERVVREVVQLTPMQSFIRHLLDEVLMKRTRDKVLKLLRKLHWEHPEVSRERSLCNGVFATSSQLESP